MTGRTVYFPKDSAWWRRSRVVELGQAHGPAGPAVLDYLTCEARSQGPLKNHDGTVKSGYAAIAHACFIASSGDVKAIVATCVEVALLDDFEEQGRTFTCRISGWHEDIEKPLAASRKASQRTGRNEETLGDDTPDVPQCPPVSPSPKVAECPPMSPIVTRDGDVEGDEESDSPRRSGRATAGLSLAERVVGVLQRGIDGITADEPMKAPTLTAVTAALGAHPVSDDAAMAAAIETRSIAQSQNRAPNIAGLFAQNLARATA